MNKLVIERFLYSDQGVLSKIFIDEKFTAYSLECPWYNNIKDVSCIPEGFYNIEPIKSNKFGDCLSIIGVPGRTHILIHAGNTISDTQGCVLPGLAIGFLEENLACLNSRKALSVLLEKIKQTCMLEIRIKRFY